MYRMNCNNLSFHLVSIIRSDLFYTLVCDQIPAVLYISTLVPIPMLKLSLKTKTTNKVNISILASAFSSKHCCHQPHSI